ncbi:MAG: tetratricopeptide repeat protein [Bacteroidales bacterium]|nr:tetratricopeptide repeat protein [Bacteroidales bacterium]
MTPKLLTPMIAAAMGLTLHAGINSGAPVGYLDRGEAFYSIGYYTAAIDQLNHYALTADADLNADYEEAMAAVKSRSPHALQLLENLLKKYPTAPDRAYLHAAMGNVCLDSEEWRRAYDFYSLIGDNSLDPRSDAQLHLHKAVAAIHLNYLSEAAALLATIGPRSPYAEQATFYQGYICYATKDYNRARSLLESVRGDRMPMAMAPFYLCQIGYIEGDASATKSEARRFMQMPDIPAEYRAEAARMLGETLYNEGDRAGAIPYLRQYVSEAAAPQPAPLYILGMSLYDEGRYEEALAALKSPASAGGAMGQSALLTSGQACYALGEIQTAMVWLDRAVKADADPRLTEEAMYNYVVVKTQGGRLPFANTATLCEEFLDRFPGSKYASDIAVYMADGYMTDNNYDAALAGINRVKNPSQPLLRAKLATLYALGARDLRTGRIASASEYLGQALRLKEYDAAIASECDLLYGDCLYHQGKYSDAAARYAAYLKGSKPANASLARYDLGYAYFSQGKYPQAATEFSTYLKQPGNTSRTLQADAANRLGDCLYYQGKLSAALECYDRAARLNPSSADYPLYQQAMVLGYQGKAAEKRAALTRLKQEYPTSPLLADAMLEQAASERQEGRINDAIATYRQLANDYPASAQGRRALYLLSSLQSANGNVDDAFASYKELIKRHSPSAEATAAAESFKELAVQEGRLEEYLSFISTVANAPTLTNDEVDDLTYRSARTPRQLEQYLEKYPTGSHAAEALITLVRDAAKRSNGEKVIQIANRLVTDFPGSTYAAEAWQQKADAEMSAGMTEEALLSYRNLEERSSSAATLTAARKGQIYAAAQLGMDEDVIRLADLLLASASGNSGESSDISLMKAMALHSAGRSAEAADIWSELARNPKELSGAKSAFYLGEYYFDKGDMDNAARTAERLISSNTPHSYWLARGYILTSDIHRAKGETFEADEYLKVLRENYPGTEPDIFNMIDQRLNK